MNEKYKLSYSQLKENSKYKKVKKYVGIAAIAFLGLGGTVVASDSMSNFTSSTTLNAQGTPVKTAMDIVVNVDGKPVSTTGTLKHVAGKPSFDSKGTVTWLTAKPGYKLDSAYVVPRPNGNKAIIVKLSTIPVKTTMDIVVNVDGKPVSTTGTLEYTTKAGTKVSGSEKVTGTLKHVAGKPSFDSKGTVTGLTAKPGYKLDSAYVVPRPNGKKEIIVKLSTISVKTTIDIVVNVDGKPDSNGNLEYTTKAGTKVSGSEKVTGTLNHVKGTPSVDDHGKVTGLTAESGYNLKSVSDVTPSANGKKKIVVELTKNTQVPANNAGQNPQTPINNGNTGQQPQTSAVVKPKPAVAKPKPAVAKPKPAVVKPKPSVHKATNVRKDGGWSHDNNGRWASYKGNYQGLHVHAGWEFFKPGDYWVSLNDQVKHKLWGGWLYQRSDKSYMTNEWEKINGKWYHFDKNAYMQKGWRQIKGEWYHLSDSGAMDTGWTKVKGKWYHLNNSGAMETGWHKIGKRWYWFNKSGSLYTKKGWERYHGHWMYSFGENGYAANESVEGYWVKNNGYYK